MKNSQLNRVLSLIKTTNDRVVIMDQATEDVVVLLTLSEYEKIAVPSSSTDSWNPDAWPMVEDELPGWVNDDSDDDNEDSLLSTDRVFDLDDDKPFADNQDYSLPHEFFSDLDESDSQKPAITSGPKLDFKDDWVSPDKKSDLPEENLADVPSEEADPPFYLEPIE